MVVADSGEDALLQRRLKAHIDFLAADEMRGRQPGTQEYNIAAHYVASQFSQMGLVPAGAEDSYYQQVPLREAWLQEGSATLALKRGDLRRDFRFVEEFYRGPSISETESDVTAEMVFAGYGIHAPELDYSDFGQIDLQGKIAVILAGKPAEFTSEEGAHFSSSYEVKRALVERGAIGWIVIYTPRTEKRFAWERLKNLVGTPSMGWLKPDGTPFAAFEPLKGGAYLHYDAAPELFEGSGYSLAQLLEIDANGHGLPVFAMEGSLRLTQKSRHENIQSPNVIGLLPGTDPLLSSEYLVYTAHLDHIGELQGSQKGYHIGSLILNLGIC